MSNKMLVKRSSVPGKVPTTAQLAAGELAVNTADAKLFFGTGSAVIEVASTLAPVLQAIVNSGNGLIAKTGTNTVAPRTLSSSSLSVTNGDGISGNPTIDLQDIITGSTGTKLTFNSKGLVTASTNLDSSDITTALGFTPENSANKNIANGYAGLDSSGKIFAAQMPSYVDDVLEYSDLASFPGTGETGKIYVALDTNKTYRWSGSAYIEISASPGSTDAVPEGATNLYFTPARAQAAVTTITGNAGTATALQTPRSISMTGHGSWTVNFDGSANVTASMTLANDLSFPGTGGVTVPSGTTAQRPASPINGQFRYNTTLSRVEYYEAGSWKVGADGSAGSGTILQTITGAISPVSGTTLITLGNTAPTITQGTQIWSGSITPKQVSSKVGISFTITADASANNRTLVISLFRGNTCIATTVNEIDTSSHPKNMTLVFVDNSPAAGANTYSARMGVDSAATWYCNSTNVGYTMGGTLASNFRIDEIA